MLDTAWRLSQAVPGIEKEDAIPDVVRRGVAMAVNDAVDVLEFPPDPILEIVGGTPAVNEADPEAADLENTLSRDLVLDAGRVHVAADGHHFLVPEDIQDLEIDEVARMEDQFGVVEVLPDDSQEPLVGPPEMRVGDDADLQP